MILRLNPWWGVVLHLKAENFWGVLIKVKRFQITVYHTWDIWDARHLLKNRHRQPNFGRQAFPYSSCELACKGQRTEKAQDLMISVVLDLTLTLYLKLSFFLHHSLIHRWKKYGYFTTSWIWLRNAYSGQFWGVLGDFDPIKLLNYCFDPKGTHLPRRNAFWFCTLKSVQILALR